MDNFCRTKALHWLLSLGKIRKFHLICRSPENLQKRRVFWKFPHRKIWWNFRMLCIVYSLIWTTKKQKMLWRLSSIIRLHCVRFASHCSRGTDNPASPFFTENASFLDGLLFTENFLSPTPLFKILKRLKSCPPSVKGSSSIMWMEAQSDRIESIRLYHWNDMQSILES